VWQKEGMSAVQNGPKQEDLVSSLPDYAQVFMFLRQFGELLAFPPVSLSELEDFFLTRKFLVLQVALDQDVFYYVRE
jgi:hypothetical protein